MVYTEDWVSINTPEDARRIFKSSPIITMDPDEREYKFEVNGVKITSGELLDLLHRSTCCMYRLGMSKIVSLSESVFDHTLEVFTAPYEDEYMDELMTHARRITTIVHWNICSYRSYPKTDVFEKVGIKPAIDTGARELETKSNVIDARYPICLSTSALDNFMMQNIEFRNWALQSMLDRIPNSMKTGDAELDIIEAFKQL